MGMRDAQVEEITMPQSLISIRPQTLPLRSDALPALLDGQQTPSAPSDTFGLSITCST